LTSAAEVAIVRIFHGGQNVQRALRGTDEK